MPLEKWVLDILVCPESKKPLVYFEQDGFLLCPPSRMRYRVEDDIPVLLIEEGERLPEDEVARLMDTARSGGHPGADAYPA